MAMTLGKEMNGSWRFLKMGKYQSHASLNRQLEEWTGNVYFLLFPAGARSTGSTNRVDDPNVHRCSLTLGGAA